MARIRNQVRFHNNSLPNYPRLRLLIISEQMFFKPVIEF
ncbi:hypothetical protein DYY67_1603 [Candidatus Nitrosotalea sp. TS]|nr:hypothetical protein [Candidatus Nitrosotalea sp. TS]